MLHLKSLQHKKIIDLHDFSGGLQIVLSFCDLSFGEALDGLQRSKGHKIGILVPRCVVRYYLLFFLPRKLILVSLFKFCNIDIRFLTVTSFLLILTSYIDNIGVNSNTNLHFGAHFAEKTLVSLVHFCDLTVRIEGNIFPLLFLDVFENFIKLHGTDHSQKWLVVI